MRWARITIGSVALIALVAFVAACGDDDAPASVLPSSAFSSQTPAATGSPLPQPTGVRGGSAAGGLTSGQVTLQLSGDVEVERTIASLVSAVYSPPPGGMAVVWTAGGQDATTVGIGGESFTGSRPTAPALSLTISAQTPDGIASFLSTGGECTVTIEVAEEDELAGTFVCDDLEDVTGVVVDVSGSFLATG